MCLCVCVYVCMCVCVCVCVCVPWADLFHGWGRRWTADGLVMDGQWHGGMQQGVGKQKLPQRPSGFTTYQGTVLAGVWSGSGRAEYNDGSIYEGQMQGGMR